MKSHGSPKVGSKPMGATTPSSAVGRDGGAAPRQISDKVERTSVSLAAEGRKNRIRSGKPIG